MTHRIGTDEGAAVSPAFTRSPTPGAVSRSAGGAPCGDVTGAAAAVGERALGVVHLKTLGLLLGGGGACAVRIGQGIGSQARIDGSACLTAYG